MNELQEVQQQQESNLAIQQANALQITDNEAYEAAGNWLRDLKTYVKRVQEFWKPLKDNAYKAWKDICAKEKTILEPLNEAESIVKGKMAEYQREVEAKERAAREELERRQREEADRLLREAQEKEAAGDLFGAELLKAQAEMVESSAPVATIQKAKADGVSGRKVWKARIIDESKVPIEVAGIVIRPVDQSALDKLAKVSNGKANVPGVEFYQETIISIRGR